MSTQLALFEAYEVCKPNAPKGQLLKWIGNKQRFAEEIVSMFPAGYRRYHEPFLGSGAVLATLSPEEATASDTFGPLMEIWAALKDAPETLYEWYRERWELTRENKRQGYERIKASYNERPNGADLLFLCRSCYGGVVRFRKADGYMSTPVGIHNPIKPDSFATRVNEWHRRVQGTTFLHRPYELTMSEARRGDLVYCDPPYSYSQSILYGAQEFSLESLMASIADCKNRGVHVALSIDGRKKSGALDCELDIPDGLFERELYIECGRSMLKRFQMEGHSLEEEHVADRLLLTF
ncbi:MAG: Dam family site-specific DNA-(adenine-N6)-methyltransferase [Capsulimonadaceae bacterium]|nr:Dam family site-specific DNA-(adenine-N6)-methyltransferase [Capsulimonadaceae bacterium]